MGKFVLLLLCLCSLVQVAAQEKPRADTLRRDTLQLADSLAYYDALFDEMTSFLDSITAPRTFWLFDAGISSGYFNYVDPETFEIDERRQLTYTPSVGYFHKSGFGVNVSGTLVQNGSQLQPFQYLATGSYDYMKKDAFTAGINFSRVFTKSNLPFYTTPLQNEVGAYFTWKKWWVKPSVFASYGWGSRSELEEREAYILSLRLRPDGFTRIRTDERISDFSLSFSVRRDFYWLNLLGKRSSLRLTPQIVFTSGTQRFGFNQNSNTYGTVRATNLNELISSRNQQLDDQLYFQPLSLSGFLRLEWSYRKLFVRPAYLAQYYFPAGSRNFIGVLRMNIGVLL